MAMKFKIGDLVWAKMKSYPPWPGIVSDPSREGKVFSEKKNKQFVVFYGSDSYAWIAEDQLWPYVEFREKYKSVQRAPQGFKEAIDSIEEVLQSRQDTSSTEKPNEDLPSIEEDILEIFPDKQKESETSSVNQEEQNPEESTKPEMTQSLDETENCSTSGTRPKRLNNTQEKETGGSRKKSKISSEKKEYSSDKRRAASRKSATNVSSKTVTSKSSASYLPDILTGPSRSQGSSLKIGFLGLGNMGSVLVHRLLKTGHDVTVWNRTPSKCRDFVTQGAVKGDSPGDVIQKCDITLSCVSDSAALKDLVFGNCGVAQSIGRGKAFVDMSTVDVNTATEVHEAVIVRGGRFLEAPIVGTLESESDDEPRRLVIIAAGDTSLYEDCSSLFSVVARRTFYLGEVGSATCMKLVVNMLFGTLMASLAEMLALGEKVGLKQEQILKILDLLPIASTLNTNKGAAMIQRTFNPRHLSLEHMQQDLRLAIGLAEPVEQPMYVTSATNELFKKAKARGYGDHDTAAIYSATE